MSAGWTWKCGDLSDSLYSTKEPIFYFQFAVRISRPSWDLGQNKVCYIDLKFGFGLAFYKAVIFISFCIRETKERKKPLT